MAGVAAGLRLLRLWWGLVVNAGRWGRVVWESGSTVQSYKSLPRPWQLSLAGETPGSPLRFSLPRSDLLGWRCVVQGADLQSAVATHLAPALAPMAFGWGQAILEGI